MEKQEAIRTLLLQQCTDLFTEIIHSESGTPCGTPPRAIYIDFGPGTKRKVGYKLTHIESTCRFTAHGLDPVPAGATPSREPISGMYYHEGHAEIGYDAEHAFLNFTVGPRYGRGYEFPILQENGEYKLGEGEELWVS